MKKLCILLILLSLFLFGCHQKCYELPLCQPTDQIIKIELSEHTSGKRVILYALNPMEILPFIWYDGSVIPSVQTDFNITGSECYVR